MLVKIRAHDRSLHTRKQGVQNWHAPHSVKEDILRFLEDLAIGKVNRGKRISEGRQAKYIDLLRIPLEGFNKATELVTEADVEEFEKALSANRIRSKRTGGKEYSHATKADIRKALKIFLRWRLGASQALQLAGWLDTRDHFKTPEFMREAEVEQLLKKCRTTEQRYLVAVLFDAGARAEEFLNIRYEDIHLPEGKDTYVKITLKQEYSKTLGRTISLYWQRSLEAVKEYLLERISQGIRAGDPVFAGSYDGMRMFLNRLGTEVLQRNVHPHLFRHSSATYYATRLNRQELCYRYGWRFSSNMPDIYISRAGMENRELDQKFAATELSELKQSLANQEQAAHIKDERIQELERQLGLIKANLPQIAAALDQKPSVSEVEEAIRLRRRAVR